MENSKLLKIQNARHKRKRKESDDEVDYPEVRFCKKKICLFEPEIWAPSLFLTCTNSCPLLHFNKLFPIVSLLIPSVGVPLYQPVEFPLLSSRVFYEFTSLNMFTSLVSRWLRTTSNSSRILDCFRRLFCSVAQVFVSLSIHWTSPLCFMKLNVDSRSNHMIFVYLSNSRCILSCFGEMFVFSVYTLRFFCLHQLGFGENWFDKMLCIRGEVQ